MNLNQLFLILNNLNNLLEKIVISNQIYSKKNDNPLEIVKKDFIFGINKLFEIPFVYVVFSKKFRDIFQIWNVYNLDKEFNENIIQNEAINRSDDSNSNKSILENLLN